jgi:hypothetical protein
MPEHSYINIQLSFGKQKNLPSILRCNGIHCYLYSGVQICISTFIWGSARMLHDLSWRWTLPKLLPAVPIRRYSPVTLTPSESRAHNSNLKHAHCFPPTLPSQLQLLLRNVPAMQGHIVINVRYQHSRKFNFCY